MASPTGRFPWWLGAVGGLFLLLAAGLVATSLADRSPPTFAPTSPDAGPRPDATGDLRVTLDARDAGSWIYFDFSEGRISRRAFEGWDLAARRFRIIANGGGGLPGDVRVARAATGSLDSVDAATASGWQVTKRRGDDLRHPLLEDWYAYDFLSHLLRPRPEAYLVRTDEGELVALRFLGYYCPGTRAGCVTFRYRRLAEAEGGTEAVGQETR